MTAILRDLARAFSSFRRWHAGVIAQRHDNGDDGREARVAPARPLPVAVPRGRVIDLAAARRVRCLSEPCANTRLAIALLREQQRAEGRMRHLELMR